MSLATARAIVLKPAGHTPSQITLAIITIVTSRYATPSDLTACRSLTK